MHVVGHDHLRMDQILRTIVVVKAGCHLLGMFWLSQQAGTVAGVHPLVDLFRESLVVVHFNGGGPWWWMALQPLFSLGTPFGEKMSREGIVEAEGDEIGGVVLSPVGKTILETADLSELIEKLDCRIGVGQRFFHSE